MIVVSDTSPVTSLLAIGRISLLHSLYAVVVIPPAVAGELRARHASLPAFIREAAVENRELVAQLARELDPGEAEAIVLAKEIKADVLLMDELDGRAVAEREGISYIGLVGVLIQAKQRGLIELLAPVLAQLASEANFYLSARVREDVMRKVGE